MSVPGQTYVMHMKTGGLMTDALYQWMYQEAVVGGCVVFDTEGSHWHRLSVVGAKKMMYASDGHCVEMVPYNPEKSAHITVVESTLLNAEVVAPVDDYQLRDGDRLPMPLVVIDNAHAALSDLRWIFDWAEEMQQFGCDVVLVVGDADRLFCFPSSLMDNYFGEDGAVGDRQWGNADCHL